MADFLKSTGHVSHVCDFMTLVHANFSLTTSVLEMQKKQGH